MVVERRAAALKQQRSIETRGALLEGAARVFARLSYSATRTRHIAAESGISEGALYFHFGPKVDIAKAVLAAQQERMTAVLAEVDELDATALDKLVALATQLADLIATDDVVQGGIRLADQTDQELAADAREPYSEWVRIARSLIVRGIADGSVRPDVDVDVAAEYFNSVFVGAQVLAGLSDAWASLPRRIERLAPLLVETLGARD